MSTTLTYGIYLALANVALSLVGYFLGYQTDKMAQGQWFQYLGWVAIIVFTALGIRAVREDSPDKSLSYGRGIGSAAMIGLYSGIVGGIYVFIHFKFVNPNFADYLIEFVRTKQNLPEQAEQGMRAMYGPVGMAIISAIFSPIISVIVGLIASIFLKRPAPAGSEPPPM